MHSQHVWEQALALRRQGQSLNEISRELGIAKSTASLWVREVDMPPEERARLQSRIRLGPQLQKSRSKKYARRRREAYERGLASTPSVADALSIGLYWGEGSKSELQWCFSNSERQMIAMMIDWAIRAGQPPGAFRAHVHVHPEDTVSDDDLRDYWSQAGIPPERIRIYRIRSATSNMRHKGKTPHGTCQLHPIRNAAALFEYYRGQRDRILAGSPQK